MKKNRSFTIIEIIVAVFIFTLMIGGSVVLIQQTLVMISLANQRLVAYNLAQEGIELVRNIRDTNWLKSLAWDTGFPAANFNSNTSDHTIDYEMDYKDTSLAPYGTGFRFLSIDSSQGYSYKTPCPCTKFIRWMRIGRLADGGILIECHVEWKERGRTHSVIVKEKLYNWFGL